MGLTVNDYPYADPDGIFILEEECHVGQDIRPVLGLDDCIVDFEITNNRPDCMSIRGLARESAATFETPLNLPEPTVKGSGGNIKDYLDILVENPELCPRYTARFIKNVKVGPSPSWMRMRLRACGIRPINNIVDITNYVMLEYGQPLHAFDYSCIAGKRIRIRNAKKGESMSTLDGTPRELTPDMLVIADETKAIGIAGVMGGENSGITADTCQIVFESANFNGNSVRKTAIALGMRTDASSRFEKGLDPSGTLPAVQRACELVELLGAGEVVDGIIDVVASEFKPVKLRLEPGRINKLLGTDIPESQMKKYLKLLGFSIDGDIITVPSWRTDISHYSDIAEEVARFYGYDVIEPTLFAGPTSLGGLTSRQRLEKELGTLCRAMGFYEILTYSFTGQSANDRINMPTDHPLRQTCTIINPLGEDTSIMRTTLLPTMLEALSRNNNYRNRDVKLYELARVYLPASDRELPDERKHLILGTYGQDMDFYILKGMMETILDSLRIFDLRFKAEKGDASYHPGRCARVFSGDTPIGILGQIHPSVAENYDMSQPVYAAELDFEIMEKMRAPEAMYSPLPRYPAVYRDIAVICSADITVADLLDCIKSAGGNLLSKASFFDVYTGTPIPEGQKSVAFSLEFRSDEKSLSEEDIIPLMSHIISKLEDALGASLRK
jgi:phenylalanyl-tRNA synthetase beta chain